MKPGKLYRHSLSLQKLMLDYRPRTNHLFCDKTFCMNYVTGMPPSVTFSDRSKQPFSWVQSYAKSFVKLGQASLAFYSIHYILMSLNCSISTYCAHPVDQHRYVTLSSPFRKQFFPPPSPWECSQGAKNLTPEGFEPTTSRFYLLDDIVFLFFEVFPSKIIHVNHSYDYRPNCSLLKPISN